MRRAAAVLVATAVAAMDIGDPRALHQCRAVYGARDEYSVVTTEDAIGGRGAKDARPQYACDLKHPYGRFVDVADGTAPVFFLEIPKTGSTSVKHWLQRPFAENKRNKAFDVHRSFTVVREPLQRFLSGYGTVRHRAARHWPFNASMSEADTFEAFVDLIRSEGDRLVTSRPKEGCVWFHVMSQTWFIELLERPIDRVLRLERLEEDLALLLRDFPLLDPHNHTLSASLPSRANTVEGNFDTLTLLRTSPRGIRNALAYLRQDYACLGYEAPVIK